MNGQVVIHKSFGKGIVVSIESNYIRVRFAVGEKRFLYPDSFKEFLVAQDSATMAQIESEIKKRDEELLSQQHQSEQKVESDIVREILLKRTHIDAKRTHKINPRANIAFKCNYCDGGESEDRIGFNGMCSDDMIRNNISIEHHVWCSAEECPCSQYNKGEIERIDLETLLSSGDKSGFICYESAMLRDWRASAGIIQTGVNKGKPMRLLKVQSNSLAVLTTRKPHSMDETRFIFAVFLVDETYKGDNKDEGYVTTNSEYKMQLSPQEAYKIKFWDYYFNLQAPEIIKFGSGLHRYLSDDQAVQILRDIARIKNNTPDESLAKRFYTYFCQINAIDESTIPLPNGALVRLRLS